MPNKTNDVSIEINKLAFIEMHEKLRYDKTFFLLQANAKIYPSYLTYHNFGVFVSQEACRGKPTASNHDYIAVHYLRKAIQLQENYYSYSALAELFYKKQRWKQAESMYKQSLKIKPSSITLNNLGAAQMKGGDYTQARENFSQALVNCDESHRFSILLSYAFTCYKSNSCCFLDVLKQIFDPIYQAEFEPICISLAYAKGEYEFISKYYNNIFSLWDINRLDYTIVCNVLSQENMHKELEEWKNYYIEIRGGKPYNTTTKKLLNKISYTPKLLYQCHYLNCPVHGNEIIQAE